MKGRKWAKRLAFVAFSLLERAKLHVLPVRFYSPVTSRRVLRSSEPTWRRPFDLLIPGWDLERQAQWAESICVGHVGETRGPAFTAALDAIGPGYGWFESRFLYCFVRSRRPQRVVEIGSGVSTAVMAAAARVNGGTCSITCIDPSSPVVPIVEPHVEIEVRKIPAQQVEATVFDDLSPGDLLFIDSSHGLYTGTELHRLYLEVLPRLTPGVVVHVHDIFLPFLHHPEVLDWFWDWQETAFLAALLTENPKFSVLCCQSALHFEKADRLSALVPGYEPRPLVGGIATGAGHFAASLWLART